PPGGAGPAVLPGRAGGLPGGGRALAGGGGDHGANLPGAARGDRGARVPRVGGARHRADGPQARDRAPLLGVGPVRPRRIAPRARCVKAAVYRGAAGLAAEDWPRPAIGPGEALLRLKGCGLCGSDIAKLGDPATKIPAVFGHEVVGEVTALGAGVSGFAVGDRVVAAHPLPCGVCHYCRRGSESMCAAFKASNLDPGGFAEYVRVPEPNVRHAMFRVPPHVGDVAASFVEPLACCVRAVRRTGIRPGDTAVVVGLGSIGCLFVQLLKRAGAAVVGCDTLADRVALARRLGADAVGSADAAGVAARALSDGGGAGP